MVSDEAKIKALGGHGFCDYEICHEDRTWIARDADDHVEIWDEEFPEDRLAITWSALRALIRVRNVGD